MKHINLTQMLQGCSKRNGMTVSASNPDGEPTVNRQSRLMSLSGKKAEKEQLSPTCLLSASFPLSFRSRYLRYAAMIFCVLAMSVANIGMAWGTDFTANDIKTGTTKEHISVSTSASSTSSYSFCSSETSITGIQISSNAGTNYNNNYIEIKAAEGYTISSLSIKVASSANNKSANDEPVVFWTGEAGSTYASQSTFSVRVNNSSDCSYTNIDVPASTRTIRLYKKITHKSASNEFGSGTDVGGTQTFNLFAITASATPASSARTYDGTEKLYFLRDAWSWWNNDSPKFFAYFYNNTTSTNAWSEAASWQVQTTSGNKDVWAYTVPAGTWEGVILTRHPSGTTTPTFDNKNNQSNDITIDANKNLITDWKVNDQDNSAHNNTWSNITLDGKTVYFDNRNYSTWTTAYVRIGHSSSNSAWGTMTKVAGTKYLYSQETDQWDYHTNFAIANAAGWTGAHNIYQPWENQWTGTGNDYQMDKQTTYQKYGIARDVYLCPTSTSMLERDCQYYNVNGGTSTNTFEDASTGVSLPQYTVTASGTNCTVSMVKYSADDFSTSSALASGGTVMPTQYIGVTVSPTTGYKFSSVSLTTGKYEQHTAAAAGVTGKYAILGDCEVSATCVAKTCTVSFDNNGGTGGTNTITATYDADMPSKASNLPTRTGYTFAGYYDSETANDGTGTKYYNADGSSAKKWNKDTESNTTLYAKWTLNSHTLTWSWDGGSTSATAGTNYTAPGSVSYGTALTYPANNTMSKDYHTFNGWSTDATTMPDNDLTITAQWTAKQYSVTHSLTGVTTSSGATGANAATYGTGYSATFAASSGYTLPNSVTVTAGGSDITANCTYTKGTGTVSIPGSYITGNIVITVTGVLSCSTPADPDGLAAGSISSSGVTFTITDDANTNNYEIYYSTSSTDPTGSTVASATTTSKSKAITGLTANTTYYAWVRAVCNDDYKSDWVALTGSTFKTLAEGTKYYLFTPTSAPNPSHTGTLSNQFHTFANSAQSASETISTYTFTHWAKTSGGKNSWDTDNFGQLFIVYDIKTNNTDFTIYYKNGNGSTAKGFYYAVITEGQTTDPTATLITGEKIAGNTSGSYTFNIKASKNSRICFFGEANSDCRFYQIVAEEMGSALPKPGEAGYKLAFSGVISRFAVKSSSNKTGFINDSVLVNANSNQKYGKSSSKSGALKLTTKGTNYLSFRSGASACQVKVCVSSSNTYYLGTSASATTNAQTSTHTFALAANTRYYINPNGSDVKVDSIVFLPAAASTYTVSITADPDGYGSVSSSSVTSVASGTTLSTSTNTLSVGATDVTATATLASAEYTYAFSNWTKSDGTDLPLTVTSDLSVYANFTRTANNYTLTWSSNGGSDLSGSYTSGSTAYGADITAPNDPTLSNYSFDGWNTANDGSGTTAGATMPAANTTYYAAWKQTVTLTTGAQGSGDNQTPYVYLNGTGVSSITPHTADGYTLQGYYTAGSGGVKVLNADGTFAAANVTDYITSGKWSRTGAAPTLYAQWVAAEDCSTSDFVIKKGSSTEFEGCMESSSYDGTATSFTAGSPTTVGNAKMTISSYSKGAIARPGSGNTFSIVIEPVSGYYLKSICWAGKVEDDETVSYYWDDNSSSAITISPTTTSGTGVTYNAPSSTTKFTASYTDDGDGSGGIWWRNVQVEVCAAGGATYNVTYDDNGKTGGSVPTDDTNYSYGDAVTVLGNTGDLAKTNYTFAGWTTNNDGTGSNYVADNTFSITANTTLYAKWTQSVTLGKNGGSTGGSATAVWNATGLTGITHATPVSGYKLTGYYTAATEGTKVLNSDGTFASSNVTDYITDGKWICVASTRTLYAQYEVAGSLTWVLDINTSASELGTNSKTSSFSQISTSNMSDAALAGSLTYEGSKKSALTGKISTPASYTAADSVYVTFQVASGYKFTPSSVKVKVQPVTTAKYAKLVLEDKNDHSIEYTTPSTIGAGSIGTVEITNGSGISFVGTVTLKIYCYGATDGYRLGTPIQIDGEVEARCATMPSFTQMNYTTTTFAPNADASGSPITIVGGENIDTYQWKYNTTNDRTSGTNCGTGPSLDPLTDVASGTTRYYWCEMTNDVCGITIKSPAVAITVVAAKSDATVSWTGTTASANYGGGGYTVTATVSTAGWDGTLTEDMLTAMDGVVLSNIAVTNDGKTISANFGVTEGANAEATNVAFYLNHPATTGYNAIDETYNTTTLETSCIGGGGGDGSSYDVRVRKNTTTILQGKSTVYGWDTPTKGFVTQNTSGSVTSTKSGYDDEPVFDSISKGNAKAYWVKSYVANVKKIRVYGQVGDDDLTATGVYHVGSFVAGGSSTAVAYSVIYEDEVDALKKGNHWFEITLDEAISTNDIIYFTVNKNFKIMGVRLTTVGAGGATLATALSAWSPAIDTRKEVYEDAASFIETVTKTGANANTMGAITYSSGDETIATVDNRTGRVTIANSITWGDAITYKDVTITASLAPSGCYQGKTATYTLRVNKLTCTEAAGTITASSEGSHVVIEGDEVKKCTGETVTLTLGGYEEGATSFQWYKDGVLQGDKTTSAITTGDAGVWYAVSNKGCAVTSTNEITITNRSTSVHATRLVKEWYIKHGRLTPDIALWELGDDCSFVSVAASDGWVEGTGLTGEGIFYEQGGVVYMKGTEPKTNDGAQQDYTLTLTVNDGCSNQTLDTDGKKITIHHQQNTDKHVLAFIVSGTDKGDWTAGVTADQTTNVGLYNAIAAKFDVLATNSRSTDDEQKLKEYYSQFDILCITDYPNTGDKGANKKSYVDALGALIDIRPILTMEAWVSKLANWKAKGLSGNPKNPTTRQYTMDLQCKDHEIFAGTDLTKVGEGDEAMYRVSMVDNTKEDYATLDATYGEGAHADKSGYEYASKPALQGFTFTEEMANDLLPIGLIDDGAGNPLQVGIERQRNMEARLMVLGINSYAMERLTVDGEQVVINALNYLMKKNAEDIADCSIYFTGGDADEDESTRNNWNVDSHWSNGTQPISTQKVRILAPCVIPSGVQVHVTDVLIVPDGPINHGADVADGSLTIEAGGALIVDGKVEETTAPNYFHPHATSAENLVLKTSSSAQAALIFDNEDGETQATVNLYSLGRKIDSKYQFQYFAVPMEYVAVNPSFAGTGIYTYVWHENGGWERRGYYTDLYAFEGVGITTASSSPGEYTMTGNLASTATQEITLTKDADGENIIGNSWTAPINIASLADAFAEDENVEKVVYIYITGNDNMVGAHSSTEVAGKWLAIPIDASGWRDWTGQKVIPAMQAFYIKATSETTLTMDYNSLVRTTPAEQLNKPLKAPLRAPVSGDAISMLKLRVEDSSTYTDLYMFEGSRFSDSYDNGWEAKQMGGDGYMQLYAQNKADKMAVLATDELEGTIVGFEPGKETVYTISFSGAGNGYYLNDVKMQTSTLIVDGGTYSFEYEAGDDANRFFISRTPFETPGIATGVTDLDAEAPKVQKIIYNDKLYIIRGGKVFSADGQLVK